MLRQSKSNVDASIESAAAVVKPASVDRLEHDLRAWYLRTCLEGSNTAGGERDSFRARQRDRCWFRRLRQNPHFRRVIGALSRERNSLGHSISLVGWLKDAQQALDRESIAESGRISQLGRVGSDCGHGARLFPELDKHLPATISRRSTTIAGLSTFLGLPTAASEVASVLQRHRRAAGSRSTRAQAIQITRLLRSWGAPPR
jgi:hypothetical protein